MPAYVDNSLFETYDYDQLTNLGKMQVFELGCALRDRYNDFLGDIYRPRELYAYTTDTDRTKMSLQLVLAGLYPPASSQTWHPSLKWMPIPYNYTPKKHDVLMNGMIKSKFKDCLEEAKKLPIYREWALQLMKLNKFLEDKLVYSVKKYLFYACIGIYNVFTVQKTANATNPEWCTDDFLETLKQHVIHYFDIMSMTTELKKIGCGALMKAFIKNMNINSEENNKKKIYLYSGHDLNIAAVVRTLNIDTFLLPPYGSAIIFEKFRDSKNQLYVRLMAYPGENNTFFPLKIGNYEFCPVEQFLKIVEPIIPTEQEIEDLYNDVVVDPLSMHANQFIDTDYK